jgi:Transposase
MDFHLDNLLNLPDIVADSYSSTLDAIVVKLRLVNDGINCPNCNKYIYKLHQTRPILVRNRTTSGVTEGINTRIKLIVRQSYGFKSFDMMKEKLLGARQLC